MKLYRFHWDCGRQGDLTGVFAVNEDGQKRLDAAIGTTIQFGEVLGKHSEVYGTLEASEVVAIPATPEEADAVVRIMSGTPPDGRAWVTLSGFNPLDYIDLD